MRKRDSEIGSLLLDRFKRQESIAGTAGGAALASNSALLLGNASGFGSLTGASGAALGSSALLSTTGLALASGDSALGNFALGGGTLNGASASSTSDLLSHASAAATRGLADSGRSGFTLSNAALSDGALAVDSTTTLAEMAGSTHHHLGTTSAGSSSFCNGTRCWFTSSDDATRRFGHRG